MSDIVKFALVIDGEVAGTVHFDTSLNHPSMPRLIAAYRSNPEIIEVSDQGVAHGWTYDGTEFHPPVVEE